MTMRWELLYNQINSELASTDHMTRYYNALIVNGILSRKDAARLQMERVMARQDNQIVTAVLGDAPSPAGTGTVISVPDITQEKTLMIEGEPATGVPGACRPGYCGNPGKPWTCGCTTLARMDQTGEILAVINEPLGLTGASLPAYGVPGDGCCRTCLRPVVHAQGLCVYCVELAARNIPVPDRMVHWRPLLFIIMVLLAWYGVAVLFSALGLLA